MLNLPKALLACLLLASCDLMPTRRPDLPPIPGPQVLPNRALDDAEIEVFWGRDRANLAMCVARG